MANRITPMTDGSSESSEVDPAKSGSVINSDRAGTSAIAVVIDWQLCAPLDESFDKFRLTTAPAFSIAEQSVMRILCAETVNVRLPLNCSS